MLLVLLLAICGSIYAATAPAEFAEHMIAGGLAGGAQVVIADLNRDGKPDIIALASGKTELVWFENPSWKGHVLATDLPRMSNLAAYDTDGDGIPEVVVAYEFADRASDSLGILSVLKAGDDPRQQWKIAEIDRIPTSHRLRFADLAGDGKKALVNAPVTGLKPDGKTLLVLYKPGVWMRQTISDENQGAVHGIFITDWDGDGRDDILTAGSTGIHVFRFGKEGSWSRTELTASPADGVAAGWLEAKPARTRFLAEAGSQVSVYRPDPKGKWQRQPIDDTPPSAGVILTADLNGDGNDEIIAGQGRGVNAYYFSNKGWVKYPLDNGGIDAADCTIADLNGDGRPDVICIGSATANLKWYENKGPRK